MTVIDNELIETIHDELVRLVSIGNSQSWRKFAVDLSLVALSIRSVLVHCSDGVTMRFPYAEGRRN